MKKITVLIPTLFAMFAAGAQSDAKPLAGRTAFYAELGGPGILFSANIDTRFKQSRLGLGGRAGIGFVTSNDYENGSGTFSETRSVITIPVQVNYIFGKGTSPHTFEVGAGLTFAGRKLDVFSYNYNNRTQLFGSFAFMYRRQPVDGGFTWRIGFTPLVTQGFIQPSGAVGVGYSF